MKLNQLKTLMEAETANTPSNCCEAVKEETSTFWQGGKLVTVTEDGRIVEAEEIDFYPPFWD